jgi:hypothetical protein
MRRTGGSATTHEAVEVAFSVVFPVDEVRRRAPPSSAKGRSAEGGGVEAVEIKE